jgi:hypothetical protein
MAQAGQASRERLASWGGVPFERIVMIIILEPIKNNKEFMLAKR